MKPSPRITAFYRRPALIHKVLTSDQILGAARSNVTPSLKIIYIIHTALTL
jgi:hypothetical protein